MRVTGAWDERRVGRFLESARIPLRLAVERPGRTPLLVSLWFTWLENALWCATQEDAVVVRTLRAAGRASFEVSPDRPPYAGVRGTADVAVVPGRGAQVLERVMERYGVARDAKLGAWLWSRRDREVALRLAPSSLYTWDYSERMRDARSASEPLST